MAKLTDVRDTPEIANGAKVIAVPVKGSTTIYQGALVALDADGYAIPGKFQSTRPVRGATHIKIGVSPSVTISIHAPRAGRDMRGGWR